jgi:hypothetical protein
MAVQMGKAVVFGIPSDVKAALGVEGGIVQKVVITYFNNDAARVKVDFIPQAENTLAALAFRNAEFLLVQGSAPHGE